MFKGPSKQVSRWSSYYKKLLQTNSRKTIFDEFVTSFWKNIIEEVDPKREESKEISKSSKTFKSKILQKPKEMPFESSARAEKMIEQFLKEDSKWEA